jgi:nucleotide-binding universal stress UspA family protein
MTGPIVLGYDASDSANAALAKTIELATELDASVVVVFGYYISPLGGGETAALRVELEKIGSRAVERAVADLTAAGVEVTAQIVSTKPADAIVGVAKDVGASLIAVGTEGEHPVTGAILGSVVLKLVQRAPVPLLVVPART